MRFADSHTTHLQFVVLVCIRSVEELNEVINQVGLDLSEKLRSVSRAILACSTMVTYSSSISDTVHGSKRRSLYPQVLVDDNGLLVRLIGQLINESLDERVHGCNGTIGQPS
jgi:hypothetical protein